MILLCYYDLKKNKINTAVQIITHNSYVSKIILTVNLFKMNSEKVTLFYHDIDIIIIQP